jgi:predicted metal-dependent phosphoesterase TrpH
VTGIDLHTHTVHSDGRFTPRQLIQLAAERRLDVVAVTDHDSTEGVAEAMEAGTELGIEVVPGIEFSAVRDGEGVHLLSYFADTTHAGLQAELKRLREDRLDRGMRMVARLRELGYPVSFERVREIAMGGNVVRPHVAQALVEAGVIPRVRDAFTPELIGDGGLAYVQKDALDPFEALDLIHDAGGVCVLAHPGTYREVSPVPVQAVERLAEAGLDGIEASHPEHDPEMEASNVELATRLGLIWTGSSDCHGDLYDPVRLGMRTTPPDQFERLVRRAEERRR